MGRMGVIYQIEVRKKGQRYGEPGELIETIKRVTWLEAIGNFNPMFCRYKGKRVLVQSKLGDLSDPFRRTDEYLASLYIEIDSEISKAAAALGRKGGSATSEAKKISSRANGRLGGRPRMDSVGDIAQKLVNRFNPQKESGDE
jgi:hypothetical protein